MQEQGFKVEVGLPEGQDLTDEQKTKLQAQFKSAVVEAINGARAREGVSVALKAETSIKETEVPETKIQIPVPVTKTKEKSII